MRLFTLFHKTFFAYLTFTRIIHTFSGIRFFLSRWILHNARVDFYVNAIFQFIHESNNLLTTYWRDEFILLGFVSFLLCCVHAACWINKIIFFRIQYSLSFAITNRYHFDVFRIQIYESLLLIAHAGNTILL